MFSLLPGPILLGLLMQVGPPPLPRLPPPIPADAVREVYWEALNQHLSKPFRTKGALVLVPNAVPDEFPPLRSTDGPPPGRKKKVAPEWRAVYQAHGIAVESD